MTEQTNNFIKQKVADSQAADAEAERKAKAEAAKLAHEDEIRRIAREEEALEEEVAKHKQLEADEMKAKIKAQEQEEIKKYNEELSKEY